MSRRLRIGLRLYGIDTFGPRKKDKKGNVQGDELVARFWKKYLDRRDDVRDVQVYGPRGPVDASLDVLIHFSPDLETAPGMNNLLYLQNAYPRDYYPGGTAGVFERVRSTYDGYLFTSEKLMKACAPGAVIPFCTDAEFFKPQKTKTNGHPVAFVGNDIRSLEVNMRYIAPAIPFGLVIYGSRAWRPPLDAVCRGQLPMPDLPALYANCGVNLDAHISEHIEYGTINLRIYDILACAGFVLTDNVEWVSREFGDVVICTEGYEDTWAKLVRYLADPDLRRRHGTEGRERVLACHTYVQRTEAVVAYLRQIL